MNPFDTEAGGDWVYELEGADDLALVRDALEEAIEVHGMLDDGERIRAVAAAEVIATIRGRSRAGGLPEALTDWLEKLSPRLDDGDLDLARRAVDRVASKGEDVGDLLTRLR